MTVTIRVGDCRALLAAMPDESVDCVVTSPPYWGLRDYGVVGQIGMEPTLAEHLQIMVEVFRDVRRVLKKDGTCWVNYGDCYATPPNGRSAADTKATGKDDRTFRDKPFSTIGPVYKADPRDEDRRGNNSTLQGSAPHHTPGRIGAGGYLKPKDLCMIPARLAIALQDDGWWIRSEIIWHKPNPMPESIRDRPVSAHEKIFLITRSERYRYDSEAVRTEMKASSEARLNQPSSQDAMGRRHAGFNERWDAKERVVPPRNKGYANHEHLYEVPRGTANLRNVWTIPTSSFREAHFATFPPALVEPCIKAGCPVGGTVLDPFGGAGTVGLVADQLQRHAIMFELNPDYATIAERRLRKDGGMLIDLKIEHAPKMRPGAETEQKDDTSPDPR